MHQSRYSCTLCAAVTEMCAFLFINLDLLMWNEVTD